MKINFLGDSITAGAKLNSLDELYTRILCEEIGATENNYGISGTRFARQTKPSADACCDRDFLSRADDLDATADFTFVFGGTNDYGHGDAPFGESSDKTPYTFCGACNLLAETLVKKFGRDKLCFILPLPRYNEDDPYGERGCKKVAGKPLSAYREQIKRVADENGIDVIDMTGYFPMPQSADGDEFTADGLHPNFAGQKLIADRLYGYFIKKTGQTNAIARD